MSTPSSTGCSARPPAGSTCPRSAVGSGAAAPAPRTHAPLLLRRPPVPHCRPARSRAVLLGCGSAGRRVDQPRPTCPARPHGPPLGRDRPLVRPPAIHSRGGPVTLRPLPPPASTGGWSSAADQGAFTLLNFPNRPGGFRRFALGRAPSGTDTMSSGPQRCTGTGVPPAWSWPLGVNPRRRKARSRPWTQKAWRQALVTAGWRMRKSSRPSPRCGRRHRCVSTTVSPSGWG